MSLKFKALGLGLLAIMATSAFAVMNAGASTGGHFVSEIEKTTIVGTESGNHRLHFTSHASEGEIGCESASYHGSTSSATVTQLDITPTYANCYTTTSGTKFSVHHNGCTYRFTVATGGTNGTADLNCSGTNAIVITHPNCEITVSPNNNQNLSGIHYTRVTENGKHAITLDVAVQFQTTYHGGICIFLGTTQVGTLKGSVTVRGENSKGEPVGITAT